MWSSCHNRSTSWYLYIKMDCPVCFIATSLRHHHLEISFGYPLDSFFSFGYLVHQMYHHVLHSHLLRRHRLQIDDKVSKREWQTVKKSPNNIFIFYNFIQAKKLIHKCLNLVDVIQQVIAFLHLAHKELRANNIKYWTSVSSYGYCKGFFMFPLVLYNFWCTKVDFHWVKYNDEHCLFTHHWYFFLHFGFNVRKMKLPWIRS
jgi:hypothetical protein